MEVARAILERQIDLTWICSARVGSIDEEMISLMKESGCHMIRIGVESGSQRILDNVKKGIRIEQTVHLMDLAHKYGVGVHAHMMLGMPGETEDTIQESIDFAKKIDPEVVTFGICTPYPGTPLYDQVLKSHPDIRDGSACNLSKLHQEGFFNSAFCKLSEESLGKHIRRAYQSFYLRPRYIFRRLVGLRTWQGVKREIVAGSKVLTFSLEQRIGALKNE
jgi:radical SAM superfamily enzyme YgiQ (UPF0313 family)